MLVSFRPHAEFLAIVSHGRETAGMFLRGLFQKGDSVRDRRKWQQVAQRLEPGDDFYSGAKVFGDVVAVQLRRLKTGCKKMDVVHQRIGYARSGQCGGQLRLPHALGQPRPPRAYPESLFDKIRQAQDLLLPVFGRNGDEDRLVKPTADQLHLPLFD